MSNTSTELIEDANPRPGDEPAHFMDAREGSAGGEVGRREHWACMLLCSDGQYAHGQGDTKEDAEKNTRAARVQIEKMASSPSLDRIKGFLDKYPPGTYPLSRDIEQWIRAISEFIVSQK